jgi:hypothetical protein
MLTAVQAELTSLNRQITHWHQAAIHLSAIDQLASESAWQGIEYNMGQLLRKSLLESVSKVLIYAENLKLELKNAEDDEACLSLKNNVIFLREQYLKAEETIHFYTVAINSRTTSNIAALLRACDILSAKSMEAVLLPLDKKVPFVLTYVDKGVGASILKAGLRLWDGNISPVAAIKVTLHNLFRPTAVIHESGHQIAHILNWNEELAREFQLKLGEHSSAAAAAFSNWASEIAADAFAFVHTGFAAVAALNDVVSGRTQSVFAFHPLDPHPISYVRVLLGIEMCRQFYGPGPWDSLEMAFKEDYNIDKVNFPSVELIKICLKTIPDAVQIILRSPYLAFGGKSLSQVIPPDNVNPRSLQKLEYIAGPALYTSHAWIWRESLKLLALIGYKIGLGEEELAPLYKLQEEWMIRLGFSIEIN